MRGTPQVLKIKVVMSKVVFSGLLTNMLLETGLGGGGQISEIRGGVKTGNFQGSRDLTPFYNDSIEAPYFGGQKSKLSRENFRGEFPPLYPLLRLVRFDLLHPVLRCLEACSVRLGVSR